MATRRRSFLSVISVISLAASATLTEVASAGEPTSDWLPDVTVSEDIAGPDLVQGKFLDRGGRGVAGRLTVIAWPTAKVLKSLADGDVVKRLPVAKAVAGADGQFTLRVDPTAPIEQFMDETGTVNFDVSAVQDNGERALFSFPRRFDASANGWVDPDWLPSEGPAQVLDASLKAGGIPPIEGGTVTAPAPALNKTHLNCPASIVATYNDRKGIVGEVYTGPNATGDFTYTNSASSTLGVGVSATGAFGSFTASGTSTDSSDAGINFPTAARNNLKVFQTSWQYRKFKIQKDGPNLTCVTDYYQLRETAWWGSSYSYNAASAPTATYCANHLAGVTVWKEAGTAIGFSNGVDVNAGAAGANLYIRTGFNTTTKIFWSYVTTGKLCGSNTSWPTAQRVVGK